MDLATRVKLKNNELLVQAVSLQQQLGTRVDATGFRSFLITFVAAPFIIGAAIRFLPGDAGIITRQFFRIVSPELRLWKLF